MDLNNLVYGGRRRQQTAPAETDEEMARRLQAEEAQGRRPQVAKFALMDRVEARYKDPELRGGTWSREYYLATVIDVIAPKTRSRAHEYMLRWDDGAEDQLVLEDYIRPAPAAARETRARSYASFCAHPYGVRPTRVLVSAQKESCATSTPGQRRSPQT